jgi:hypothetical protein
LLDALGQMFQGYGPNARGQIILNATNLLANLEGDATYGAAAGAYNNQAVAYLNAATDTSAVITGTAATGAPIAGQVVAIDANGLSFFATTGIQGAYTVNVAGGTAPFILTVTGSSGGKVVSLNSVATAVGQTVNITPLTDLIVSAAAGRPAGAGLASLCTSALAADQTQCRAALTAATTGSNLSAAVAAVTGMIAPLNASGADPLNGMFAANGSGMDAVLDAILVSPAAAQGAMATVSLISVPGQALGTVTLPASVGAAGSATTSPPSEASVTAAATATVTLAEIRACSASFAALYPANMMMAPTPAQVLPFVDASFSLVGPGNGSSQAMIVSLMSSLASDGNGGIAKPGLTLPVRGFSPFDFTAQTGAAALDMTKPAMSQSQAWVQIDSSSVGGGMNNWKMVKGAPYAGCPGGWKLAGTGHADMHMMARISKSVFPMGSAPVYIRSLPFHVNTDTADAQGIGSIVVTGPGLNLYSGNAAAPVGAAVPITLLTPPVPTPPQVRVTAMTIQGVTNGYSEQIQSCQDMAASVGAVNTPCYDEAAVAPGAVFTYTVYGPGTTATRSLLYKFPYQIGAVPLSMAFVRANEKDLFAQNIKASPAGVDALNTAIAGIAAGTALDNVISFSYTQSAVYGARTDHCGLGLTDAGNTKVLEAEQDASGHPTRCTFRTAGLNSGSLTKPVVSFGGTNSYMSVDNVVLGNQAGSTQPY